MSLGLKRTRRNHKADSSSESEGKETQNDKIVSNNASDNKIQYSIQNLNWI